MPDTPSCNHLMTPQATKLAQPAGDAADKKIVALTFDDGPSTTSTDEILALLDKYGIKATFFVVGEQVSYKGERTRAAFDAGHLVENHSYTHPEFSSLSADDMADQIDRTTAQITGVGAPTPTYFRPPYGDGDGASLAQILSDRGMTPVYWTIDSRDWELDDVEQIHQNVLSDLQAQWDNGNLTNIVLFHDIQPHTPSIVDLVIPDLQNAGVEFVRIDAIA